MAFPSLAGRGDALGVSVEVESILAEEADECLAACFCEVYGQAGRGGDGGNDGDAGGEGFLKNLEGGPSADEQDAFIQWEGVDECAMSNHFIDRIVSAHIFPQHQQLSIEIEEGGCMKTSCAVERGLMFAHGPREFQENRGGEFCLGNERRESVLDRLDGSPTADPAA